jgi:hypothetical protein
MTNILITRICTEGSQTKDLVMHVVYISNHFLLSFCEKLIIFMAFMNAKIFAEFASGHSKIFCNFVKESTEYDIA